MECTSIKFELFWRKISRKDGCKGVSENAHSIVSYFIEFSTFNLYYLYSNTASRTD